MTSAATPEPRYISIRCTACRATPGRGPAGMLCSVCRGSTIERMSIAEIEERLVEKPGKFLYIGIPIQDERHLGEIVQLLGLQMQAPIGSPPGSSAFPTSDEEKKPEGPVHPPRVPPPMFEPPRRATEEGLAAIHEMKERLDLWVLRRPPLLVDHSEFILLPKDHAPVLVPGPACEWNPWSSRPATEGDLAHARAEYSVGRGSQTMRLCRLCAAASTFRRRSRTPL